MDTMYTLNARMRKLEIEPEILPLAKALVAAGCRPESGLWIAIKYAGYGSYVPNAELMAGSCELSISALVTLEREDLHALDWNIAKYAKPISSEFLLRALRQTATVREYTQTFMHLLDDLPAFSEKCAVYFAGLSSRVQGLLGGLAPAVSFEELVARAHGIEKESV